MNNQRTALLIILLVVLFWGGVIEDNSFGTHEFLDLCELLDTEPYLAVNVGSGTPEEAMDWVEYVTSDENTPMTILRRKTGREDPWDVKYWAIGNENRGCGGNMTADYYADLFKRFYNKGLGPDHWKEYGS